jgi:hypothetical protein
MATATKLGPIGIGQINDVIYVGGDGFGSIQGAVDYVQRYNAGVGEIVILHGYPGSEDISALVNGSFSTYISDQRDSKMQNWEWTGGAFQPAVFMQLADAQIGGTLRAYGFTVPDMTASYTSIGTGQNTTIPVAVFVNAAAAVDGRQWIEAALTDRFIFAAASDTGNDTWWMQVLRSGTTITKISLYAPVDVTGVLTSQGSPVRTFANTPDSGGGGTGGSGTVNPGTTATLPFYPVDGALVSPSHITTDADTQSTLDVPSTLKTGGLARAYGFVLPDLNASNASIGTGYDDVTPAMTLINAGAPTDQRMWVMAALTDRLIFSAEMDSGTDNVWMQALRSGSTISKVTITPAVDVTGVLTSQGSPVRTFANTPSGGGGVNPGTTGQMSFYGAAGQMLSPSLITTDSATQTTLTVPDMLTTARFTNKTSLVSPAGSRGSIVDYWHAENTLTIVGPGWNFGSSGGWSVAHGEAANLTSARRGITQSKGVGMWKQAIGDCCGINSDVYSDGGVAAGSDEGVSGLTMHVIEPAGYFHGTIASTTGTGDQAPVLTYTSGSGWTTDGAFLLNISKGTIAGNMTGPSTPISGSFLNALPVNVTLPLTTKYAQLNAGIADPGTTADSPVAVAVTVTLLNIGSTLSPAFAVGDVLTLAGNYYPEQTKVTAAGAVTGGNQQSVTLMLRNPNDAGGYLFCGGIQGQYLSFDANLNIPTTGAGMRSTYYAFGSLTGSDLIYGVNVAGLLSGHTLPGSEAASTSGANTGFHLYPGAEIVKNTTTAYAPTLEQNRVAWAAGDVVENPHYPIGGGNGILLQKIQHSPSHSSYGSTGIALLLDGAGFSGGGVQAIAIRNNNPTSIYTGAGGPLYCPPLFTVVGLFGDLFNFERAPDSGNVLFIGGPGGNASKPITLITINYTVGGKIIYDPTPNEWQFAGAVRAAGDLSTGGNLSANGSASFVNKLHGSILLRGSNDYHELVFTADDGSGSGVAQRIAGYFGAGDSNIYYDTIGDPSSNGKHVFRCAPYGQPLSTMATISSNGLYLTNNDPGNACQLQWTGAGSHDYQMVVWGSSIGAGLPGVFALYDITRVALVWNTNTNGDMFFSTPLSGNNVAAGVGAPARITAAGLIDGTAYSVGGVAGASGTITSTSTVTVVNGIITNIA